MDNKKDIINMNDAIKIADIDNEILKRRKNGFLLSDYQINVLNSFGINYLNYTNYRELLFYIEEYLTDFYDENLDNISSQISELIYYKETKK